MKTRTIVVTGTLGFDFISNFNGKFSDRIMPDKLHKISLSFLVDTLTKQFGGTAGNIGYSLTLLGIRADILAPAGNDFSSYKAYLKMRKVSTGKIKEYRDCATSLYSVMTDVDDNQIGSFYVGATKYADTLKIPKCHFAVLSPTIPTAMIKYVMQCKKLKIPYLFDPAFQIASFSKKELLEGIDGAAILIGNDYEITLIEKKCELTHEKLLARCPIVITTKGGEGSLIETKKEKISVGIAKVKAIVDPTGAGDAYRAGFLAGYLRGFDLKISGQMGAVAAAYTVEKKGTITHIFTTQQFAKRYKDSFGEKLSLS